MTICCLHFASKAQLADSLKNIRQDIELISWTENYTLKIGYAKKIKDGYIVHGDFYKAISGFYSLDVLEQQDFDTASIVLYRLHIGSDHDHSVILRRIIKSGKPSEFKVYGRSANLQSVHTMYLFFDKYTRFSIKTKEYCYRMLLQNYDEFINPRY